MRHITLDGRLMDTRAQLHRYLQHELQLPPHYGSNLDALSDCLGEMRDVAITLRYPQALLNSLGAYGKKVTDVFCAAARGRDDFSFTIAHPQQPAPGQ